ncbi:hypothetical protein [Streptomyces sp. NBC_01314]|uniref:hypothetical protein n=1 Tax=Streptomyces sp. NBC_01314 TaxID=2903821 RepID=UPI003090D20B|nr:hypothetical protein OG622_28470 [Streptomyces sp. NBC_01314]
MLQHTVAANVDTRIWNGTHDPGLIAWLGEDGHHFDGTQLVIHTTDGDIYPEPGWTIARWPDRDLSVMSSRVAVKRLAPASEDTPVRSAGLCITAFKCPFCTGGLVLDKDGRDIDHCHHCAGTGLTADPCGEAERAPRPPGVMRAPCGDCAYRPGSPELEANGARLPEDEPFYCHQGLPVSASGAYTPVAMFRGLPLGAMVCAGWWAHRTGEPLPAKPYRENPITEDQVEKRWGHRPLVDEPRPPAPDVVHPDENAQVHAPDGAGEFRRAFLDDVHASEAPCVPVELLSHWVPPCPSGRHSDHPALTCDEHESLRKIFSEHLQQSIAEARARYEEALVSFRSALESPADALFTGAGLDAPWFQPGIGRAMEILAPHLADVALYQPGDTGPSRRR